jgi:hypothetical protein
MSMNTVQDIEQAIGTLSPPELEELCGWLERYQHPLDTRIESDFASGRLDHAIQRALDEEQIGNMRSL